MKRRIFTALLCACLFATSLAYGGGLLPSLTNAYGVSMPSLTEALLRYPENEETVDGAAVEHWIGITEDDFNTFGVYLKKSGATLQDYQVEGNVFTSTIAKDGRTFSFVFDTGAETAVVTYPAGTYDERLFAVKSVWSAAEVAETAGQYAEAAGKYASLIRYEGASMCYRDSDQRELQCYYADGEARRATQDWDGAVTAFTKANTYNDAAIQIIETRYQQAKLYMEKGDYTGALCIFYIINGYKDVESLLTNDHNLVAAAAARDAKYAVGKYVTFGHYLQTSGGNDSTPIEWLVLARDGNKALLLSRYGLDVQPYNKEYTWVTWEKCTLRTWLNDTFINIAFTVKEQMGILLTNEDNANSQEYSNLNMGSGNNTQDYVFLLNYSEANKYLGLTDVLDHNGNRMKPRVSPTEYALQAGAYTNSDYKTSDASLATDWWLRNDDEVRNGYIVTCSGFCTTHECRNDNTCVRPALWINLESDIF